MASTKIKRHTFDFEETSSAGRSYHGVQRLTRICQLCTRQGSFWCLVAVCCLLEPILCSRFPTLRLRFVQYVVLGISTILYVIQVVGMACNEWEKVLAIEAISLGTMSSKMDESSFQPASFLAFFSSEGEYILEGAMLLLGWVLIFWYPGLATLRCFRVFRLLWFYEVDAFRESSIALLTPLFGGVFVTRGIKVLKFATNALTAIGSEMFKLGTETRGALILMMMFFYSAFVLGATLFVETKGQNELCISMGSCLWTLVRLTFFDGDGLDFAYFLTKDHRILFFILMIYLCITSFGILNGLVGIFGTALARASHDAFEEDNDEVPAEPGQSAKESIAAVSDDLSNADDDAVHPFNESNSFASFSAKKSEKHARFMKVIAQQAAASPNASPGKGSGFANMFAVGGQGANRPLPSMHTLPLHTASRYDMMIPETRSMTEMHRMLTAQCKMWDRLNKQLTALNQQATRDSLLLTEASGSGDDFG